MSEAIARIGEIPPNVRAVWNADTCPPALLPWLAWAFSVDTWDVNWSDQQKRDTVKQSLAVHKIKGTIGSVRNALAALGFNVDVLEWFNQSPTGTPYTFNIEIESDQNPVDTAGIAAVLAVVMSAKNLRSHLDEITIRARSSAPLSVGAVALVGSEITVEFDPGT